MKIPLYPQRAILFLFSINGPELEPVNDTFKGIFRAITLKYEKINNVKANGTNILCSQHKKGGK